MQRAKAFVFAAEEDFGIVAVEAQACGTPVIAYGKGGALETVIPLGEANPTGVHFEQQSVPSLLAAVDRFESQCALIKPAACRVNAERFSAANFRHAFMLEVTRTIAAGGARIGAEASSADARPADPAQRGVLGR